LFAPCNFSFNNYKIILNFIHQLKSKNKISQLCSIKLQPYFFFHKVQNVKLNFFTKKKVKHKKCSLLARHYLNDLISTHTIKSLFFLTLRAYYHKKKTIITNIIYQKNENIFIDFIFFSYYMFLYSLNIFFLILKNKIYALEFFFA
jgi:hypothetical protein